MGLRACYINTTITEQVLKYKSAVFYKDFLKLILWVGVKVLFVTICKKKQISMRKYEELHIVC